LFLKKARIVCKFFIAPQRIKTKIQPPRAKILQGLFYGRRKFSAACRRNGRRLGRIGGADSFSCNPSLMPRPRSGSGLETGKGEYGEGDVFLGLTSAQIKEVAYKHKDLSLKEIQELLKSKIHEERVAALRLLVYKYQSQSFDVLSQQNRENKEEWIERKKIFDFYLKNAKNINNWDLVDLSAPKIVGDYLLFTFLWESKGILYKLTKSKNLWERWRQL